MEFENNKLDFFKILKLSGSCIIISIACLDPGNLEGDMDLSYKLKYNSLWVLLLSHIILYFYQECALTIGAITNKDIATLTTFFYDREVIIIIWLLIESALIAADVQEIMGASIALNGLFSINIYFSIILIIIFAILILYLQELGQKIFELTFFIMLFIMALTFGVNFIYSEPDVSKIFLGTIIKIPDGSIQTIISVIGAIVMPQNLFLHSGIVITRSNIDCSIYSKLKLFKIELIVIILLSIVINYFICGTFFNFNEKVTIVTAASYIKQLPFYSVTMWYLGLLASGLSSTTSGALTGQFIINGYLNMKISRFKRNLISRTITLIPCYIIFHFFNVTKIMNYLNIIQFIQLPFVVIPMIHILNNTYIMKNYKYKKSKINIIIFFTILLQIFNMVNIYTIIITESTNKIIFFVIIFLVYYYLIYYITINKNAKLKYVHKKSIDL